MANDQKTLRIFFIFGDKTLAERNWISAPRVGDHVRVGKPIYRVTEVLWGMAVDDNIRSDPTLHVTVEKTERIAE